MTLPDILVPTYVQMLGALSAWLAKAEAQMPDGRAETLLVARLAPDMFPLSTQIRFACVQAQEGMFRLLGQAFPPRSRCCWTRDATPRIGLVRWRTHRRG